MIKKYMKDNIHYINFINNFVNAAKLQGKFLEKGDIRNANREMNKMSKAYQELEKIDKLEALEPFLNEEDKYVKLRIAVCLLPIDKYNKKALNVLNALKEELNNHGKYGYYAITAECVLRKWQSKN